MSHAEVLLAHAYFVEDDPRPLGFMHPLPPLHPAELAAWLEQEAGATVELWDPTFRLGADCFAVEASRRRPELMFLYAHPTTRPAGLKLLRIARRAGLAVVVGGPDAGLRPRTWLEGGADAVLPGECEDALLQLLLALRAGHYRPSPELLSRVPGLLYLDGNGEVKRSAGKYRPVDLDRVPWPQRPTEATRIHLERWRDHRKFRPLALASARGCPVRCGFDTGTVFNRPYRRRAPADVVAEMRSLVDTFEVDRLVFVDEIFFFDAHWLREFAALLAKEPTRIPFEGRGHPAGLDAQTARRLRDVGLVRIDLEAASGSSRLLRSLDWSYGPADVYRAVDIVRGLEAVSVGLNVLVGLPGETREDLDQTMELVRVVQPDGVDVTRVDPGAPALFRRDWERVVAGPIAERGVGQRALPEPVLDAAVRWMRSVGTAADPDLVDRVRGAVDRVRRPLLRAAVRLLPGRGPIGPEAPEPARLLPRG